MESTTSKVQLIERPVSSGPAAGTEPTNEEKDQARREFFLWFDDIDVNGNNRVSEVEMVSNLPWLLSDDPRKLQVDLDKSRELVRKIIALWDADFFDRVPNLDRAVSGVLHSEALKSELSRNQLVDVMVNAYCHGELPGYRPGNYEERVEFVRSKKRAGLANLEPLALFFWEQIKFFAFPVGVFALEFGGPMNHYRVMSRAQRIQLCLITLPIWSILGLDMLLWVLDAGSVRSADALQLSEFLMPFFMAGVNCIMWNTARFVAGLGPYGQYRLVFPNHHSRFRALCRSEVSAVELYTLSEKEQQGDRLKSSPGWQLTDRFTNAYQVYKNIFNIVGHQEGYGRVAFHNIIKDIDVREDSMTLKESPVVTLMGGPVTFALNAFFALVVALIHPIVRVRAGGDFFADNSDFASIVIVVGSILTSWFFLLIILVGIDRQKDTILAFDYCLQVLSALTSRKDARRVQYSMPPALRTKRGLECPWLNLGEAKNLRAWDQIRRALVEEWHEIIGGFPLVFVSVPLLVLAFFGVAMLTSLFFFFDLSGDGFRWLCFVGGLLLGFRLFYYFEVANRVNENKDRHLEILSQVKLTLHVTAERYRRQNEYHETGTAPAPMRVASIASSVGDEQKGHPSDAKPDEEKLPELPPPDDVDDASDQKEQTEQLVNRKAKRNSAFMAGSRRKSGLLQSYDAMLGISASNDAPSPLTSIAIRHLQHASLVSTFIEAIGYSAMPYMSMFGWKVDRDFQSRFVSVMSVWFLLVVANFFLKDFNF